MKSLATPESIRTLQTKLCAKAKKEPTFRFYALYDKVYRGDILGFAYRLAKANAGAPGVDRETFEDIEAKGLENWIKTLQEELRTKQYRPKPVRRVYIPKPGGGERPLGIPCIRDRVVQTAAVLVLNPIFEADFPDEMYGYREERNALDAVKEVYRLLRQGYTDVVDADLSKYFDTIPHADLLKAVARRVSDGAMLQLIKTWLKAPVEEKDTPWRWRRTQGKDHNRGTPQGAVASPLLANIYMRRFVKTMNFWGGNCKAHVINFADDFIIACKGSAEKMLRIARRTIEELGLKMNEEKTKLKNAKRESFDFLGYTFGPKYYRPEGRWYLGTEPSRKAARRFRERIRHILRFGNHDPWLTIAEQVNLVTQGWAGYFSFGTLSRVYWWLDTFLATRVRNFLQCRRKVPGRGTERFRAKEIFGELGIISFRSLKRGASSNALV